MSANVMTRIDEIKARLAKITPGEWEYFHYGQDDDEQFYDWRVQTKSRVNQITICKNDDATNHDNGKFIARAPADVAYLLERLETLESKIVAYVLNDDPKYKMALEYCLREDK